jgi:hypothetical protein
MNRLSFCDSEDSCKNRSSSFPMIITDEPCIRFVKWESIFEFSEVESSGWEYWSNSGQSVTESETEVATTPVTRKCLLETKKTFGLTFENSDFPFAPEDALA